MGDRKIAHFLKSCIYYIDHLGTSLMKKKLISKKLIFRLRWDYEIWLSQKLTDFGIELIF
jgi:hypothetical protein